MTYEAKILADSISPDGVRLTTMEVQMPRFLLPEFNTHRKLSRNSASSRAIPPRIRIQQVIDNPFVPESFGRNQRGMQAGEALSDIGQFICRESWLKARDACVIEAQTFVDQEAHKQHANRLIELWAWHTVVVTSSDWRNFFALRVHKGAQPEMQIVARCMRDAFACSKPIPRSVGEWHLPYVSDEEREAYCDQDPAALPVCEALHLSVVKCAAVSYERQDAERTPEQIRARHGDMVRQGHWSPFEHQAKVANLDEIEKYALYRHCGDAGGFEPVSIGNLDVPWLQYRKTFEGEAVFAG